MAHKEDKLNYCIGGILEGMRKRWQIQVQELQTFRDSHKQSDILITEAGAAPIIIEHEPQPGRAVEAEARDRLGLRLSKLSEHPGEIQASIALRSAAELRQLRGEQLQAALRSRDDFEYALYRGRRPDDAERWPAAGWLRGSLADLALLAQQAMRPSEEIERLAEILETGIELARRIFTEAYREGHEAIGALFAEHLRLEDGPQTRRMAMAILANALIFQQSLASHEDYDEVRTPERLFDEKKLHKTEILQDWDAILERNYYPIFHVARAILRGIDDTRAAAAILRQLFHIIEQIVRRGAARSHDLAGFVFQRLIADRKFLATFYTRPESAALLAALALPAHGRPEGQWADAGALKRLRIADFACGTGTLLAAVYGRIGALHELAGGEARALHRDMLERVLVGCDVLPMAVHLTLSMLAAAYPEETFRNCTMLAMPYGKQETGEYALGSLDLLATQEALPTLATRPEAVEGYGQRAAEAERHTIADGSYDLVIMNPPFTRPNNKNLELRPGVEFPAFAALETTEQDQLAMMKRFRLITEDGVYHGQAGIASAFVALADKKLRQNGTLALVLPSVAITGVSWEKFRKLLREKYSNITVVTIAGPRVHDKAFSADTGLGECLVIARRGAGGDSHARFVTLQERPRSELDALHLASDVDSQEDIRRLENGPYGGTVITVGEDEVGQILDFPIPDSGTWQLVGIADFSIAQMIYQLVRGRLWLPRMPTNDQHAVSMTSLSNLISDNPPHHSRIECWRWEDKSKSPSAPFEIHSPPINDVPTYPTLWAHDAERERCIELLPDSEAVTLQSPDEKIRTAIQEKTEKIWATATCAHFNRDFRYNTQALCVASTPTPCIGGRAWPSIIFPIKQRTVFEKVFAVWCNSTLGILCYWWVAGRQDGGRGSITVTALPALPTLDLRRLSAAQLAAAARIFADHRQLPMLPINQIDEDENRAELDRRLLTEVLDCRRRSAAARIARWPCCAAS